MDSLSIEKTITITYSLPTGKVKTKTVLRELLKEFIIQLKNNKCKLISWKRP